MTRSIQLSYGGSVTVVAPPPTSVSVCRLEASPTLTCVTSAAKTSYPASYDFVPPPRTDPFRQRGRVAWIVAVAIIGVVGVAGGVYMAMTAEDAKGASLSIVYAMLPLPLVWFAYWWLDRYEPEPRRYKIAAFVWGGVVAVGIAIALQLWISSTWDLTDAEMATFIAPITEEPAKGLFLLALFLRRRRIIDGPLDGLIVAGLVGVGFAFVENIGYYAFSYAGADGEIYLDGAGGATATFVVRGVFSPFAHPLFTSAVGIAVGFAVTRRSWWAKVPIVAAGLAISMGLHLLWNGSLSYGEGVGFVLVYLALGAVLVIVATIAIIVRLRQVRTLEESLVYVAQRGWIHPAEIPYLSRFSHRRAARRYAAREYGKVAGQVVRRYQQVATEMAFLHDRVMRGQRVPNGVERTYALLDQMYALRPGVRLPPALAPYPA